mgnify:FL=1
MTGMVVREVLAGSWRNDGAVVRPRSPSECVWRSSLVCIAGGMRPVDTGDRIPVGFRYRVCIFDVRAMSKPHADRWTYPAGPLAHPTRCIACRMGKRMTGMVVREVLAGSWWNGGVVVW